MKYFSVCENNIIFARTCQVFLQFTYLKTLKEVRTNTTLTQNVVRCFFRLLVIEIKCILLNQLEFANRSTLQLAIAK